MRVGLLHIYDADEKPIGTQTITDERIRSALKAYDDMHPFNDYPRTDDHPHHKTWLEHKKYKYAIRYEGRCYPPKAIIRLAIGSALARGYQFGGGEGTGRTNWVLRRLGFEIIPKLQCKYRLP
jgi:hypothetical protein